MSDADKTCTVKVTEKTPNGIMPTGEKCGKPAYEVLDDEIVNWINEEWAAQGFMIMDNGICKEHLYMTPEV